MQRCTKKHLCREEVKNREEIANEGGRGNKGMESGSGGKGMGRMVRKSMVVREGGGRRHGGR